MEEIAIVRSLSESELYSTSCPFLSRGVSKCVSYPFMLLRKANLKAPVSKIVDFWVSFPARQILVADPTYNPKASVSDDLQEAFKTCQLIGPLVESGQNSGWQICQP